MDASLQARAAAHPLWYHTMELASGTVTPGWFDLRPVVDHLPWPDVAGKRCLDIGTWDGFLAFELERRGAAEVVATDIAGHADWDHLPRDRANALAYLDATAGEKGAGFEIAREALGSNVRRELINIYDISPERLGTFDVVVCGSLLLHLHSPFRALEAVRSVCRESFLSCETIDAALSALSPRRPAMFLDGEAGRWMLANAAGHRRMLDIAGFDLVRSVRPYVIPYGEAHPTRATPRTRLLLTRLVTRGQSDGVLHSAVLSRPALQATTG